MSKLQIEESGVNFSYKNWRIIDLTMPIHEDMPNYPLNPKVEIEHINKIENSNENSFKLILSTQTGTHIESGFFANDDLEKINEVPIHKFIGYAAVIDIPCQKISIKDLKNHREIIEKSDMLFLRSGYMDSLNKITQKEINSNKRPYITLDVAKWISRFNINILGIDSFGFDPDPNLGVHKYFGKCKIIICEGLVNLKLIKKEQIFIIILPLKICGVEGSLVRAIAIEDF